MINCKNCGSDNLVKNGKTKCKTKQRFKCKICGGTYIEGDERFKYSMEKRFKVIRMYLEGVGIRSIERLENVPNPLIIYWIKHFSELIQKEIKSRKLPKSPRELEIVEIDELFSYYKKRPGEHMCGLLLTETAVKLLISK